MPALQANGIRQFYRSEGNPAKPTVVLAHPVGFDHGIWDLLVPLLTPHAHVLRYDLRGHGGTEAPPGDYSVDLLASDALALMAALDIRRAAFYGVSLGGLVGLWIAATQPGALASLAVSNLSAKLPLPREEWDRRIALARSEGLQPFAAGIRERMFSAAQRAMDATAMHTSMNAFLANDPQGYASALAALRDADLTASLNGIATRTLVIRARDDAAVPPDHPALIAQRLRSATLVTVDGGHLSPLESAGEVCRHLQAHFS